MYVAQLGTVESLPAVRASRKATLSVTLDPNTGALLSASIMREREVFSEQAAGLATSAGTLADALRPEEEEEEAEQTALERLQERQATLDAQAAILRLEEEIREAGGFN